MVPQSLSKAISLVCDAARNQTNVMTQTGSEIMTINYQNEKPGTVMSCRLDWIQFLLTSKEMETILILLSVIQNGLAKDLHS